MSDVDACDHACSCGHDQQDHSSSGWCNPCGDDCANSGHYPSECLLDPPRDDAEPRQLGSDGQPICVCRHERWKHNEGRSYCNGDNEDEVDCDCGLYEALSRTQPEPKQAEFDPVAHARQLLAEHQAAQAAACQAEIQAVLDRYGMRLEVTTPQVAIVPKQ